MAGLNRLLRDVGSKLSKSEAEKIARQTGKSYEEVLARALEKDIALGAATVRTYQNQPATPATGNQLVAREALAPLQGLQIGKGQAYHGATTYTTPPSTTRSMGGGMTYTPGSTTYNPIITTRSQRTPAAPATPPATPPVQVQPMPAPIDKKAEPTDPGDTFDPYSLFGDFMSMMPDYGAMFGDLESQMVNMYQDLPSQIDVNDPIQLAAIGQAYGGDLIRARQRQRKTRSDYLRNQMNNMAMGGGSAIAPLMIGGGLTL